MLEAVAAPSETGKQTVVLRKPTQHWLTVRGSIVDARIASPENGVLHNGQPSSNQLSVANGLASIDSLMICVWIYHLVIDPHPKRSKVPRIGEHARAIRGVDNEWRGVRSKETCEPAHRVTRRVD